MMKTYKIRTSDLGQKSFKDPAVLYKPISVYAGAERYAVKLAETLNAPLYTPYCSADIEADIEIVEFGDEGSCFSNPFSTLSMVLQYENFDIPEKHDLVITTGGATKSAIHHPHQHRIHILQMPPRWLYDLGPSRFGGIRPIKWIKRMYQSYLRIHDRSTTLQIDDFVVPSEVVARRLETYYNSSASSVIYPPIPIDNYYNHECEEYLFFVGRLTPEKGIDEIVKAVGETDYRLKIAGTGPLEEKLEQESSPNVELLGFISEEEKLDLLARCDAVVFNSDREPFGIVPVEAFASGKPVVGVREGFTCYQIEDGVNGVLFDRGEENMRQSINEMYDKQWDPESIQQTAKKYDISKFETDWKLLIYHQKSNV